MSLKHLISALCIAIGLSSAAPAQQTPTPTFHWPGSQPVPAHTSTHPATPTAATNTPVPIATRASGLNAARSESFSNALLIDSLAQKHVAAQGIPGLSLAVVQEGELVYAAGYGMANVGQGVAVNTKTIFCIASVSKPLTAVAALQLAERSKLNLRAPVQTYVQAFPQKQWQTTSHFLLSHLAGIRHYKGNESKSTQRYMDVISPLDIFKNDPLVHQPGTAYLYSSYGYNLLGAVIQEASGMAYIDYMNHNIFQPSGMSRLRIYDGTVDTTIQAVGYMKLPDGATVETASFDATNKVPSGGFLATASDIGLFTAALFNDRLISKQTRKAMWEKQRLSDGSTTNYGLGWSLSKWRSNPVAFHTGKQPGFSSLLYTLPNREFAIILLSNLDNASLVELAEEILKTVF